METPKKAWYKRPWVMILGGLIIVSFVYAALTDEGSAPPVQETSPQSVTPDKSWQTVSELSGNGAKKSAVFELSGSEAKITYKYNSGHKTGSGAFVAYVLGEDVVIDRDGALYDLMSDKPMDEGESFIHKSAGRYYLSVEGMGDWEVSIQELK